MRAVLLEWTNALLHAKENPIVMQWKAARRSPSHRRWIVAAVIASVAVFAIITAPIALYLIQFLILENPELPEAYNSASAGICFWPKPGLYLFRIAIVLVYLPWMAYAVYSSVADACGALSDSSHSATSRLLSELRLTPLTSADFVVAAMGIILPRLWLYAIVGGLTLGTVLISLNEQLPGERWAYDSGLSLSNVVAATILICLGGVFATAIMVLTFFALGRGSRSWLFTSGIASLVAVSQLAWICVLFSEYGLPWETAGWQWTYPADELVATISYLFCLAVLMLLVMHFAAKEPAVRKAVAILVLGIPLAAYIASFYVGTAIQVYSQSLDSKWQQALSACPQLVACTFALINTVGYWPSLGWEHVRLDFEYYAGQPDYASIAPYIAYLCIQLAMLLIAAYFARDAVIRWRRGDQ